MFVATLGYSRRVHVRAFRHEKQESWFTGLESAFTTFGGVPEIVLMDNPRAFVVRHDAVSRTVQFNDKLKPSPSTGALRLGPVRPIGPARKARPSAASAT